MLQEPLDRQIGCLSKSRTKDSESPGIIDTALQVRPNGCAVDTLGVDNLKAETTAMEGFAGRKHSASLRPRELRMTSVVHFGEYLLEPKRSFRVNSWIVPCVSLLPLPQLEPG